MNEPQSVNKEEENGSFISRSIDDVRWLIRVFVSSADRFYWDNGFSKAASLAYTSLFAIVPVLVLAFGLLGSFALSNEHLPEVRDFIIRQFVPQLDVVNEILVHLTKFSEALRSLNLLAVVFVVVTAVLLLNSIEFALNEVWQVYESRSISHRIGIFCTIIVVAPILAVSTYYFASFRLEGFLSSFGGQFSLDYIYKTLLPFLIDFGAFWFLYYYVPKAPVTFRSAVIGGALAALLFGLAKEGFASYIERFSSYDKIYGALASLPIFLFWLYLAWTIVLFGAEISYQAQYLPRKGKLWKRAVMSIGDGKFVLALQALTMIVRGFLKGEKLPNDLEIAESLGCSSVLLKPILDALGRVGIIQRGDSRLMPLVLMRSPDRISLQDISVALQLRETSPHMSRELTKTFQVFSTSQDPSKITLADICRED